MFNSPLLDVAIAMTLVYLLLSLIVSGITEFFNLIFRKRAKFLEKAIAKAFADPHNKNWSEKIFKHPLIKSLKAGEKKLPSYISSDIFAKSLIDIIARESLADGRTHDKTGSKKDNPEMSGEIYLSFCKATERLTEGDVKDMLRVFIENSTGLESLRKNIETWYNEYMDRVSGWFKKHIKKFTFLFAVLLTLILNVDSLKIVNTLWKDAQLRDAVVKTAEAYLSDAKNLPPSVNTDSVKVICEYRDTIINNVPVKDSLIRVSVSPGFRDADSVISCINGTYDKLEILNIPLGWGCSKDQLLKKDKTRCECMAEEFSDHWIMKLIGWLLTAIMLSFGAPFWFDLLNRLVSFRATGKKPKS